MNVLSRNARVLLAGVMLLALQGCSSLKESDYVP